MNGSKYRHRNKRKYSHGENSSYYDNLKSLKRHDSNNQKIPLFSSYINHHFIEIIDSQKKNSNVLLSRENTFANMNIELERSRLFKDLRVKYRDMCRKKLDIDDPKESFNRWIMERHTKFPYQSLNSYECDPLLPFSVNPLPPPSLYREIMEDIPCKIYFSLDDPQLIRRNIILYIEATFKLLDPLLSFYPIKVEEKGSLDCLEQCKNEEKWIDENRSLDDPILLKKRFHTLRSLCDPYLHELFKPIIESLCHYMVDLADKYAKKLINQRESFIEKLSSSNHELISKNVLIKESFDSVKVSYGTDSFYLHSNIYKKLKILYKKANEKFDDETFGFSLWSLHFRYRTLLGGLRKFEGSGLQAAVPHHTFDTMNELFDVSMECFASPFNCYFSNFCSVFNDIDTLFNSSGSFFHFNPTEGSFEANPPFCEEVISKMNEHMEKLLEQSNKPLSFIIFLPHWVNPPCDPIEYLKLSKYTRKYFVVEPEEHRYLGGFQQDDRETRVFKPVHSSIVFFLQNEEGYKKWTPTEEKVEKIRESFRRSK